MRIYGDRLRSWHLAVSDSIPSLIAYDGADIAGLHAWEPILTGYLEFVYFLFDADDQLLYVGRSWSPGRRFQVHRRKQWWSRVDGISILAVTADTRTTAEMHSRLLEALAIRELFPLENTGAPAVLPTSFTEGPR